MRRGYSRTGRGLYRSNNGIFLGVCRGFADHFDFSVFWIRAVLVALFITTGFFPVLFIYILAAFIMKSDYRSDRRYSDATESLRQKVSDLGKRMRNVEDCVTSKEYRWHRKFGD